MMRYLHTMLRVRDLDAALDFYCNKLGLQEVRRRVDEKGRFTLVFLAAPEDETLVAAARPSGRDAPLVELTYNWDTEDYGEARYFGHLAYEVDDIYAYLREADEGAASPSTGRRATAAWPSCARPTSTRSSCCRKARRCRPRSRGPRCRTPGTGKVVARPCRLRACRTAQTPLYVAARFSALRLAV